MGKAAGATGREQAADVDSLLVTFPCGSHACSLNGKAVLLASSPALKCVW